MVRLTDRPDMTLDVYRGRKTTIQYNTALTRRKTLSRIFRNIKWLLTSINCYRLKSLSDTTVLGDFFIVNVLFYRCFEKLTSLVSYLLKIFLKNCDIILKLPEGR